MNSSSRPTGLTRNLVLSFASALIQVAIAFNVLGSLTSVRAQENPTGDDSGYIPGRSAEDRLKSLEKSQTARPPEVPSTFAPPPNDNFANASGFIGSGGSGFTLATNIDATGETGEPIHGAGHGGSGSAKNSIWYSFTSAQTRVISIWTSAGGSSPIGDPVLSVYQGSPVGNLSERVANDDYPGMGLHSKVTFAIIAGVTYRVAIDGYDASVGTFYVNYSVSTAASNDQFSQMEVFTTVNSPYIGVTGSTTNATGEPGEPNHANNTGTLDSIWYGWTAPADLSMTFSTDGNFDRTLSVYVGNSVNGLTLIENDHDDGPNNGSSRVTFNAVGGITYRIAIEGFGSQTGNSLLNWGINRAESGKQFDFDGDLKTDYSVYRPGNNVWYTLRSSDGGFEAKQWGLAGDILVPGIDYDGDAIADFCIWRPSTGIFYAFRSSNHALMALQWGTNGDIPVQGDFDGDDRSDFAVWRPPTGVFYVYQSTNQAMLAFQWGINGDKPATGDYDGDGKTDFAVWRPSNGVFYIFRSWTDSVTIAQWGLNGDVVVPGDYDHDGKNDIAVYRPSTNVFYARKSFDAGLIALQWGIAGDLFAPGDYDGNGYSDVTVWRPSTGTFWVWKTPNRGTTAVHWGQAGDMPVPNSNVH